MGNKLLLTTLVLSPPLAYLAWRKWHRRPDSSALDADAPPSSDDRDAALSDSAPARAPAQLGSGSSASQPAHPPLGRRLTTSVGRLDGTVSLSDGELLAQARQVAPGITLDELAAARLIASERGDVGTTVEWCCIVDAELNRADRAGRSLYQSLTRGKGFGRQGPARPASTRQDGYEGHLAAARAVFSGEARGIARGAVRFFDPADANAAAGRYQAWLKDPAHHAAVPRACDALTLLRRWSFGLPFKPGTCELVDKVGADNELQSWVGPIFGVNPWRLMLFKPAAVADAAHADAYEQARQLIERAAS